MFNSYKEIKIRQQTWEQRNLGEVTDYIKGFAFKSSDYKQSGVRIIRVSDLTRVKIKCSNNDIFVSKELAEMNKKYRINTNEIIITTVGSKAEMKESAVGRPIIVIENGHYMLNQNLVKISALERYDNYFIYSQLLQPKYTDYIATIERGNANQANIAIRDLWEYRFFVPKEIEQRQLGTFFKTLENIIALHQRKLAQLQVLKNAYLQRLFPSETEKVPKLRFANFNNSWKLYKLGEVAQIIGGGTPETTNDAYWNGSIDWYSPAEIGEQRYLYQSKRKISEIGLQKSSAKLLPVGSVLFTSRAGIGNTAILCKEAATNQGFQTIVPKKNKLDSYFIFSRTNELKKYGEVTGAGSTFIEVSGKQMEKMPLNIPKLEEQKLISNFFRFIDDAITLHQQKLDQLKKLKSAYLQKMFT